MDTPDSRIPGRFAVHVEEIIGEAVTGFQGELADGNTPGGVDVGLPWVGDLPAGLLQQAINGLARFLFRLWNHGLPNPLYPDR